MWDWIVAYLVPTKVYQSWRKWVYDPIRFRSNPFKSVTDARDGCTLCLSLDLYDRLDPDEFNPPQIGLSESPNTLTISPREGHKFHEGFWEVLKDFPALFVIRYSGAPRFELTLGVRE